MLIQRIFITSLAIILGFAVTNLCFPNERPNIVLILIDDLGWQDSSVVFGDEKTKFQEHYRTPHLSRLAKQGIRFSNAYSHAVCSPTRTSVMLGQNPARHHVTNWTLWSDKDQSGKTARLAAPQHWRKGGIQPKDRTLAEQLRSAGYFTIHCGKAHWGAYGTDGADPRKLGFNVNIAGHPAGGPGHYHGQKNFGNNADGSHKKPWGVPGLKKYHGTDIHLTDALALETCLALDKADQSDKPFFLYFAPYAVHAPIQEHGRFIKNYRGKKYPGTEILIPESEARYASMVQGYDAAIGQILKKIEQIGQAENTIIIFTSDNGGLTVHARGTTPYGTGKNTHNWPLREGKGSAYEGGTRVPLLVSWAKPNGQNKFQKRLPIKSGTKNDAHTICEDYYPTICAWAGVKLKTGEANRKLKIDGIDITKYVRGEKQSQPRPLVFHYPHVWGPKGRGYQPHSALRLGDHKVIYFYDTEQWELYNISKDIGEQTDLSKTNPKLTNEMANRLDQLLNQYGAQYPTSRQHQKPVKLKLGSK